MLSRSNLPTQTFSSVADAIDAAVKIKTACTAAERKELVMFVTESTASRASRSSMESTPKGILSATDTQIDKAYVERRALGPRSLPPSRRYSWRG